MNLTKTKLKDSQMQKLLKKSSDFKFPKIGEIIKGKVIAVGRNEIYIDIQGLACGVVRGPELIDESGEFSDVKVGDEVAAQVLELENELGILELSFREAGHKKAWDKLAQIYKEGKIVPAQVVEANRGGLMVRVNRIIGFLPVSQLIPEHYPRVEGGDKQKILERLKSFVGKSFQVKIIDLDEKEEKLILSEKAAWEERQRDVFAGYKVGDVIEGKISGIVDFGVFVEFGPKLEGLVHISEIAWQRLDHPSEIVKLGQKVKCKIISMEGSKISLSMRALKEDPWKHVFDKYKVGQLVKGKVLKLNPFGAFVELDPDIHGLAHISELSYKKIEDPGEILEVGKTYTFKIISIEPEDHRLGLSFKKRRVRERKEKKTSLRSRAKTKSKK